MHELIARLGFLGQFSAFNQVELRTQVDGPLTLIYITMERLFAREIYASPLIRFPMRSDSLRQKRHLRRDQASAEAAPPPPRQAAVSENIRLSQQYHEILR
jgi:hypothetical protein